MTIESDSSVTKTITPTDGKPPVSPLLILLGLVGVGATVVTVAAAKG